VPSGPSEPSGLESMQLEGAAWSTVTVGGPPAPSASPSEAKEDGPRPSVRTVYALVCVGRANVYCSSACCVSTLLARGWKLSDPGQLSALVRELATGRATPTHDPSDHFT
jgi:hypothetical protein